MNLCRTTYFSDCEFMSVAVVDRQRFQDKAGFHKKFKHQPTRHQFEINKPDSIELVERLSMTFTANGKRQTANGKDYP